MKLRRTILKFLTIFLEFSLCLTAPIVLTDYFSGTSQLFANDGDIPHQVFINADGRVCGGSIIDRNNVITAAHCLFSSAGRIPTSKITVAAGSANSKDAQIFKAHYSYTHLNYNGGTAGGINDIAIIKISPPLIFSEKIGPIAIADFDIRDTHDLFECGISGYGKISNSQRTNRLHYGPVDIKYNSACDYDAKYFNPFLMICGGGDGTNTCSGDSGGPLVCQGIDGRVLLHGIVSRGPINCLKPKASSFTAVAHFTEWIIDNASHEY